MVSSSQPLQPLLGRSSLSPKYKVGQKLAIEFKNDSWHFVKIIRRTWNASMWVYHVRFYRGQKDKFLYGETCCFLESDFARFKSVVLVGF